MSHSYFVVHCLSCYLFTFFLLCIIVCHSTVFSLDFHSLPLHSIPDFCAVFIWTSISSVLPLGVLFHPFLLFLAVLRVFSHICCFCMVFTSSLIYVPISCSSRLTFLSSSSHLFPTFCMNVLLYTLSPIISTNSLCSVYRIDIKVCDRWMLNFFILSAFDMASCCILPVSHSKSLPFHHYDNCN